MLKRKVIDGVKLHFTIKSENFWLFVGQLMDTAEHHGVKPKNHYKTKKNPTNGLRATLVIDGQELRVGVMRCMKSKWIEFGFNGVIDVDAFDSATVLFGHLSFRNAMLHGSVKRFELAIDYEGLHTSQFVNHFKGTRSSRVVYNKAANGVSYYSGSRESRTQMVVYDKAQQLTDTGGKAFCKQLLRIELRVENRKESLFDVIQDMLESDPFENFYIVDKAMALTHETKIKDWPIFLSTCSLTGTANALRQFPQHKKSFLEMLKKLSISKLTPSIFEFQAWFCCLLKGVAPTVASE